MRITVIGTGFVGVVTSAVFAKFGHQVIGLDIDASRIGKLQQGEPPFFEPRLEELLQAGISNGNLHFTTEYEAAISEADIIMIAVGTPSAKDGTADLKYVKAAAKSLAPFLKDDAIVAIKSTVPPGTNDRIARIISDHTNVRFFMASLPEFLREGSAVTDTLHPDRVVIGATEPLVIEKLLKLHEDLGGERVVVSPDSAQMAKYTANAYLAQRITFINQIANLCEKNGAAISEVIQAIGHDKRIGTHYWYPGLGYGGSCFPKDVKELAAYAKSIGEEESLLIKIDQLNEQRIRKLLDQFDKEVGGFKGKTIAVLGLSFKPNTDDMREAPSLTVIPYLKKKQATIKAYDPQAMEQAGQLFPHIFYADTAYQAVEQADIIILLTEWDELVNLQMDKVKELAASNPYLIDTRNQFDHKHVSQLGFNHIRIGNG